MIVVDQMIVEYLCKWNKCSFLIVNKVDIIDFDFVCVEFSLLGLGDVLLIVVVYGCGINYMLQEVLGIFFKDNVEEEGEGELVSEEVVEGEELIWIFGFSEKDGIKIVIIGWFNVGKLILVNCMFGEEWVIVYDQVGIICDSIYILFECNEEKYILIDIVGVWCCGKIFEVVEKFLVVKIFQVIQDVNVVIFVMDVCEGVVEYDFNLFGFVFEIGCVLVIVLNKWDGMEVVECDYVKIELEWCLLFVDFVDIYFILVLYGIGVGYFYKLVQEFFCLVVICWLISCLISIFEDVVQVYQLLMVNGCWIKLCYVYLGGVNLLLIVIYGNQVDVVLKVYICYLEKIYWWVLKLVGMLICIEYKGGENFYEGKKNLFIVCQVNKKCWLMLYYKKVEKKKKDKCC